MVRFTIIADILLLSRVSVIGHLPLTCYTDPVLDPKEFPARFAGGIALDPLGRLITNVLVIWATSFGVGPNGEVLVPQVGSGLEQRRMASDAMVKELLEDVDRQAVMRTVSWDGVRLLLLLLPLAQGKPFMGNLAKSTVG